MHAVVVGGGIAGLATAVGLGRAGWRVTVLERQPELSAAGAGILLWPNALYALDALGLGEQTVRAGVENRGDGGVRAPDGSWLSRINGADLERRLGRAAVTIHRAELHRILVAGLADGTEVRTNAEVTAVPDEGDLVVVADGIHSALRRQLAPESRIRDSGQVAWRAVTPGEFDLSAGGGETAGRGWRFGLASVGPRGVYWYAAGPGPLRTTSPADQLAELRRLFAGWHDPIPALLAAARPEQLLHHQLADLDPVPPMRYGIRIALMGDAAHAMTPNLGQGAAQALEDAVTLIADVAGGDLAGGLARYDAARRPRGARYVRDSRRAGQVFGATGRAACALRDLVLRATPGRVALAQAAKTAGWRAPALPVAQRPERGLGA
ncbi:FAD-dependent oxidoreductase [Virgisporangium ochraceum]|uniref:Monooxygenase n=1 Tax=Virgisporangium ochraceum TaxID=65505 RepID=A0A8J4EBK5_9ACTN|nr:FAD-dependent oxidoreductase [Virgisporangium ochraceum]GIJ65937.1 monooxygenase [Virgisporangium ochraceum]